MLVRKLVGIVMLSTSFPISIVSAHAQGPARAQAWQQLNEAQQNDDNPTDATHDDCVGPVSFCSVFFGS